MIQVVGLMVEVQWGGVHVGHLAVVSHLGDDAGSVVKHKEGEQLYLWAAVSHRLHGYHTGQDAGSCVGQVVQQTQ